MSYVSPVSPAERLRDVPYPLLRFARLAIWCTRLANHTWPRERVADNTCLDRVHSCVTFRVPTIRHRTPYAFKPVSHESGAVSNATWGNPAMTAFSRAARIRMTV